MSLGKDDDTKLDWMLIEWSAMEHLVRVRQFGSNKYDGAASWTVIQDPARRFRAAAMRHLLADAAGEKLDPESGQPHLAHVMCNMMFLLKQEFNTHGK